jgi:hypothetical protein
MKKLNFFPPVFLLLFAQGVAAQGFNYQYVEVGYASSSTEVGATDIDGDVIGFEATYSIDPAVYVGAAFGFADFDFDIEQDSRSLFLGLHQSMAPETDAYVEAGIIQVDVELPFFGSDDDTGFGLVAGLRHWAAPQFEVGASASYVDVFDDSDTSFSVEGQYYVQDTLSLIVDFTFSSDSDSIGISVRSAY